MRKYQMWMVLGFAAVITAAGGGVMLAQTPNTQGVASGAQPKGIGRSDEEQEFKKSVKVALVVGVSDYPKSSGLAPLHYAANDADAMASELQKRGYFVETLTNADAMHQAVYGKIAELSQHLTKDQGTFLFFFSGHGFAQNDKAYLATFDTNDHDLTQGALDVQEVATALKNSGAKQRMMFLDACRDDALLPKPGTKGAPPKLPALPPLNEGLAVLWATKAQHYSYEDPASKHGIYTNYLLKALEGGAAQQNIITFRGLSDYVSQQVLDNAQKKRLFQQPYATGEASGDFIIATININIITENHDSSLPPPPPPDPLITRKVRPVWRGSDTRIYDVAVTPEQVQVFFNHQLVASAQKDKSGKLTGTATKAIAPCPDLQLSVFGKTKRLDNFKVDSVSDTQIQMKVARGFAQGNAVQCQGLGVPQWNNFTLLLEALPQ